MFKIYEIEDGKHINDKKFKKEFMTKEEAKNFCYEERKRRVYNNWDNFFNGVPFEKLPTWVIEKDNEVLTLI